jgi:hydroxymethylpyrimidine pyrophosphatase-like HAD family hydrolase
VSDTAVFSDLDRTLIYSVSARGADVTAPLRCVEEYEGRPLSFLTERAAAALEAATAPVVPVTTRTVQQYRRVRLPGKRPPWAVCTNGGRVLVDGEEHVGWTREVTGRLASAGAAHAEMLAVLREQAAAAGEKAVLRVHEAEGVFGYAIVDRARLSASWLEDLSGRAAERAWRVSVQGRKLYCVPAALTKSAAATWIALQIGADRWVAAGDSLLDRDLLEAADAAVMPVHGELAQSGWTARHVAVAPGDGVAAGEWIVDWLLGQAAAQRC